MEEQLLSINDVFKTLKRRWRIIVSIILICLIGSTVYSFFIARPVYKVSTKLFIGKEVTEGGADYNSSEIQMYQKLIKTYAGIAQSEDVIQRALDRSNIDLNAKSILANMEVTPGVDDQFLTIALKSEDPSEGLEILNNIIDEFIETSSKIYTNGNISVVTTAKYPDSPISPNKMMNIAISFILGLMIGVGLSFLLEYLDDTAKSKDEVEAILGVPVLGVLPEFSDEDEKRSNRNSTSHKKRKGNKR